MVQQADIGLIGMAVMGQNLVLNMVDHGYSVAVFNRTVSKVDEFLAGPAKNLPILGCHSLEEFFASLKRPRRILLMVKAGEAVDEFLQLCLPYLDKGDVILDGGNSFFGDTHRRCESLESRGVFYIGAGISGGEEGARHGPSIMPGGHEEGWPLVKDVLQSIAAKVDSKPCCEWIGDGGAGHFVKMVHNGIEYGDMQLIAEAYGLLRDVLGYQPGEISTIFQEWNQGDLDSYLVEITSQVFSAKDSDGFPLIDRILDVAGQKGTGRWSVTCALELGCPLTLIAEAVCARCLSAAKDERVLASHKLTWSPRPFQEDPKPLIDAIRDGLYASKIVSYAQGFMLMSQASQHYHWNLDLGTIALLWRGGCIIRSQFLNRIEEAFRRQGNLSNLLLDDFFVGETARTQPGWRRTVALAVSSGIALPCMSAALAFFDGYRTAQLPANLIQAQRDFFGAHTYERVDKPRGSFFHTQWTGNSGSTSASTYNA